MSIPEYVLIPLAVLLSASAVTAIVQAYAMLHTVILATRSRRALKSAAKDAQGGMDAFAKHARDILDRSDGGAS